MSEQATALEPQSTILGAASMFESFLNPVETKDEEQSDPQDSEEAPPEEPSEEPAEDSDEGQPDEGDEEPPEEEEAPEEPEDTLYTVKVDGEEKKVPVQELVAGYQRQADYTRKTQQLATERKAANEELDAARAERAQNARVAEALLQRLNEVTPKEPDWRQLQQTDPIAFASLWAQKQIADQERQQLLAVLAKEQEDQTAVESKQRAEEIQKESENLLQALPEWKDPEKARAERRRLKDYGLKQGFTSDDLDGVYDHRVVLVLRKAMLYDALQERRPEVKKHISAAPPVVAPGAKRRVTSEETKIKQRLAKTGRVEDAAAAFESMLR